MDLPEEIVSVTKTYLIEPVAGGVDDSSRSSAEVKNEQSYTSTTPVCICGMGLYLYHLIHGQFVMLLIISKQEFTLYEMQGTSKEEKVLVISWTRVGDKLHPETKSNLTIIL